MRASVLVVLHKWLMLHKGPVVAVAVAGILGIPSAAFADDAFWVKASRLADSRIDESSSLAVSRQYMGTVYTANDESDPVIFAVDIPTGDLVGTTRLTGTKLRDPEAMALDRKGRLWLADTGDNDDRRRDTALYVFPEQGPTNATVRAVRYPIAYSDGESHNVETLLINPFSGAKYLVTKTKKGHGAVFAVPRRLYTRQLNVAMDVGLDVPKKVSDGAISPNGDWVVLRDEEEFHVYNAHSGEKVQKIGGPSLDKPESLSFNPSGRSFLVGSEGKKSPLYWVGFNQATGRIPTR